MAQYRFISMLIGLGMMSACSDGEERGAAAQNDNGADVARNVEGGEASPEADANSATVSIDLPGVKGKFSLPKLRIGSEDVEIDGVRLYPGSRVRAFEVAGQEGASEGSFTLRFEADAAPEKVQRYFLDAFKDKGVSARARGRGVAGADHEGKAFTIDLDPQGEGTRGVLTMAHKAG